VENALLQDGPEADDQQPGRSRFIAFDSRTGIPLAETVYLTGPAAAPVSPTIPQGLVEAIALDNNGTFLTLERGPSTGPGLSVRLFLTRMQGALDVAAVDDLVWDDQGLPYTIDLPAVKEMLVDFADLGLPYVNNYEGMTLGPVLADGRQTLVLVSDNNFSILPSEFMALALTLETVPAANPALETAPTFDMGAPPQGIVAGDSADSAIWIHPEDPTQSLVAVTLRDGGLQILSLAGEVLQSVVPLVYGDVHYNSVDVVYNFPMGDETADLFVVSDRKNDTLAILRIDPADRRVMDITSPDMPGTLFGIDDADRTAYGLTTYTSPRHGQSYVYVTQANGNLVAQVALAVDANGRVSGTVVRTLALPTPTGVAADSQAEGIVVDRLLGNLYVGMDAGVGLVKFDAELDGDPIAVVVQTSDDPSLTSDTGGLSIYYGPGRSGYLLVSNQGDQSYEVFGRDGDNPFLGRFIISDEGNIDQVNAMIGIDVSNVALGVNFPSGLMVVHDGVNDPQNLIADGGLLRNNSNNFKFVRWDSVANAFPESLQIDTGSYNPRRPMRLFLPTVSGN
jgi:myo-inositol-hexaphosphate 3-phosphohydrolase